jgi:hypothetical protein
MMEWWNDGMVEWWKAARLALTESDWPGFSPSLVAVLAECFEVN